jgi:hypothetical protein
MKHARNVAIKYLDFDGNINLKDEYYDEMKDFLIKASVSKDNLKVLDTILEKMSKDGIESLSRIQLVTLIEMFSGKILYKMTKPSMKKIYIDNLKFVWVNGGPKEELIRTFKMFVIREYRLYYN